MDIPNAQVFLNLARGITPAFQQNLFEGYFVEITNK
jgi:hypothetical protein